MFELSKFFSGIVAIGLFAFGYLMRYFLDKRERKNSLAVNSAQSLLPLIGEWHSLLVKLVRMADQFDYQSRSIPYIEAEAEFRARRSIASELDYHLTILKGHKRATRLVSEVEQLFGLKGDGDTVQFAISNHVAHGLQPNLIAIARRTNSHKVTKQGSRHWLDNTVLTDFESWSAKVGEESARFVSSM